MPTLTQLSSNLTEIVIYAAIALVTLTGLCKCIYPLLRNATLLNRAVRANISTRKPWWTSRATPSWRSSFRAC